MKNIMIRDDVYDRLSTIKGKKSFSETIEALFLESVEKKRRNLRKLFGCIDLREKKELGKFVLEVRRVAKSRLF
ncbi:MAG: antitoxin [Candidatus Altiarchaeota archaeon]|nr:antitoxin [Candidatus Altiarchaeota archaeon]